MPVSHLTSSRAELLAALLNVLDEGANASALTMTEAQLLAAIRNTYGGSVSALTTSQAGLLASIETAAGGSGNALTESRAQMLSGFLTARGGSGSHLTLSEGELLAGIANIPAEGGGEPTPLAVVDFANATYSVGATSHTLREMLPDETLVAEDISGPNGWFPPEDQYSTFGAALSSVIGTAGGVIVVVDAECVSPFTATMQLNLSGRNLEEEDKNAVLNWNSPGEGSELTFGGWTGVSTVTITNVTGRKKLAVKASTAEFAIAATGAALQTTAATGFFDYLRQDSANTYIEAGTDAAFKVYSIKFYASDSDLAALVAA